MCALGTGQGQFNGRRGVNKVHYTTDGTILKLISYSKILTVSLSQAHTLAFKSLICVVG